VDKDWKEKFFYPANHVREVESKKVRENNDASIIEDWVSDDEDGDEPNPKVEKKTVIPTATKKEFVTPEKPLSVRLVLIKLDLKRSQQVVSEQMATALASPKQTAIGKDYSNPLMAGSTGFHQVIDFLNQSHICYALTKKPDVYISFIKQFWRSAEATTDDNGEVQITATMMSLKDYH
ncbi:hypothetical protein Tco_0784667, partial [Tanacetum coccineum]